MVMKKPKGNKKNKPKKKWSKLCGYFLFKNTRFGPHGVIIDLYFKDELIGFVHFTTLYKYDYRLTIYSSENSEIIGEAECLGSLHGLPKKIKNIYIKHVSRTILAPKRKVLVEKLIPEPKISKIYAL